MKKIQIQELGFDSWLECFKMVEKDGNQNRDKIYFEWDAELNLPSIPIKVCEIKSRAFDEIYKRLPGKEALDIIHGLLKNCGQTLRITDKETILAFLRRFPSKQLILSKTE